MAGAYDQSKATALKLLAKKGRLVALTREAGPVNEITGRRGTADPLTGSFNCVTLPPGRSAEYVLGSLQGRNISEFHMARVAGGIDPAPGDIVTFAGADWKLVWTANYDPDGSGLVYTKAYGER